MNKNLIHLKSKLIRLFSTSVFLIVLFYLGSLFLKIKDLNVVFSKSSTFNSKIQESFSGLYGEPLFFNSNLNRSAFENIKKKYPMISSIEANKKWPFSITIKINIHEISFIRFYKDNIYGYSKDGVFVGKAFHVLKKPVLELKREELLLSFTEKKILAKISSSNLIDYFKINAVKISDDVFLKSIVNNLTIKAVRDNFNNSINLIKESVGQISPKLRKKLNIIDARYNHKIVIS